jgi:S-formylglutathione hydrolase FrmB
VRRRPGPARRGVERFSLRAPGGRSLEQIAIRPERAGERPPLLVFLHGRTDGTNGPESNLSDAMLEGLSKLGSSAPAVLLVNGGSSSYYHDRDGGDWASYTLRAVDAGARRLHADRSRVAIGGISMGGFGALHLATREKFCAVGGHSPALWRSGGETPEGAFDDGDDFAASTPFGRGLLARRAWLDVGDRDPFRAAVVAYGRERGIRVRVWPGEHEGDYWHAHMGAYLRFYARALARCEGERP